MTRYEVPALPRGYRVVTRDLGFGITEQCLYDGRVLVEKRRIEPAGATPVGQVYRQTRPKSASGRGTT